MLEALEFEPSRLLGHGNAKSQGVLTGDMGSQKNLDELFCITLEIE